VQATPNFPLTARQHACEKIPRLWDLDIWVDFKADESDDPAGETSDEKKLEAA
jgi:hypothetical protein